LNLTCGISCIKRICVEVLTRNLELILDQLLPQFFPTGASAAAALLALGHGSQQTKSGAKREGAPGDEAFHDLHKDVALLKDSSTDSDANHSSPDDGSLKLEPADDSPRHAAAPAKGDDGHAPQGLAGGAKAPYQCPKCHFSSNSRRRIVNHANLRHSLDCSSIF